MNSNNKIKKRIIILLGIAFYFIVVVFYLAVSKLMLYNNEYEAKEKLNSISNVLNKQRVDNINTLTSIIFILQNNTNIKKYWLAKNRNSLTTITKRVIRNTLTSDKISYVYFHDTNSVNFLRVHNPELFGDEIQRHTLQQAKNAKIISNGLEMGEDGNIILSVVAPWYINGKLVGFIELAENIKNQIDDLHDSFGVELFIMKGKNYLNSTSKNIISPNNILSGKSFGNYVLICKTSDWIPENIESIVDKSNKVDFRKITIGDKTYTPLSLDLQDRNLNDIAKIVILLDISSHIEATNRVLWIVFGISFSVSTILFIVFYFILGNIEEGLIKYEKKAKSEVELRELEQRQHITELEAEKKRLKNSEEKFRLVFEEANDAILWASMEKSTIINCNKETEVLLEREKNEIIGSKRDILFEPEKVEKYISEINNEIFNTGAIIKDVEIITKSGKKKYVNISAKKIEVDGEIIIQGIFHDLTEKKKSEEIIINAKIEAEKSKEIIEVNEQKIRSILDALPDIIFIFNRQGVFLEYHADSKNELSVPPEIFLGKNISEVLPSEIAELTKVNIEKTLSGKGSNIFKYSIPVGDKIANEEARMVKLGNDKVLTIIRDITGIVEAEKKLIEAKNKAERADKLKTTFLAQMSHEIRTPINSIVSLTALVEENLRNYASSDINECFNLIRNSGDRIIRTTDLVINLSELEAGTYEVYNTKLSISELLSEIIEKYEKTVSDKGIKCDLQVSTNEVEIFADEYTVYQIFYQLVDNAVKYTVKGGVSLRVYRNDFELIVVEIIDTGVGISEAYLDKIFTPFSQEEMGYTRRYEGNGIGLTLVKKYCKLNDAEISIESSKWVGTTVRIVFNNR